jgi:hypothetical protein
MRIHLKKLIKILFNIILLLLLQFSDAHAQSDITLDFGGNITGEVGEQVTISVNTSDLTDLDVTNFDFEFAFDPALIQFENADILAGELLPSGITKNVTDDNRILASFADSSPISGSGTLITMTGTLLAEGQNIEGFSVTDIFMGDGSLSISPSVPFNISVTVEPAPQEPISWFISPEDVELSTPDPASFSITIEQTAGDEELTWDVTDDADWLTVDGASSGAGSGSVTVNADENTSTASRSATITVQSNAGTKTVSVSQPGIVPQNIELDYGGDITARVGDEVSIPVTTSELTDLNVANFDFEFQFDSSLLEIQQSNITAGPLVSSITKNVTNDDRVLVSFADSSPIEGSGVLFTITANAIAPGLNENGIVVSDVLLGDGSSTITPTVPTGISVEVVENEPPVVSIISGPADGSTIDFNNPDFAWDGSDPDGTVTEYEVDLQGPSATGFLTSETNYEFADLADGNYLFRVRAIDNEGSSSQWAERTFTVAFEPPPLPAPDLISPTDGAEVFVEDPTIFSWSEVDGATGYEIQFDEDDPVSTGVDTEFELITSNVGEKTWRARGMNGSNPGDWSAIRNFTVVSPNQPPTVAIVNGPADGNTINFNNPGFAWEGVDEDGTVVEYEVDLQGPSATGFLTSESNYEFADLADGNYLFRVKAEDNDGSFSDWAERSFTVDTSDDPPMIPDLISPEDGATDQPLKPSLDWDPVNGASEYGVQVSSGSAFTSLKIDEIKTETQHTVADGVLSYGITYYWRVEARNESGSSGWSTVRSFTTEAEPETPVLAVSPASTNVSSNAGSVTFQVSNDGGGTLEWSVETGDTWLSIEGSDSGTGSEAVQVAYFENTSENSRTGTVTITSPNAENSPNICNDSTVS